MTLQYDNQTAYYFPTTQLLEKFISLNEGKIEYEDVLLDMRKRHEHVCFRFKEPIDGKFDWNAHTINYAKEYLHVNIITFGYQRTE